MSTGCREFSAFYSRVLGCSYPFVTSHGAVETSFVKGELSPRNLLSNPDPL